MGLNDISFTASLIADFYKNNLIETSNTKIPKHKPGNTSGNKDIQYLGKNAKGVCVLVDYANEVYLPDEQLNFLTTILQACKLNLGDVAIINRNREKISFDELRKQVRCNYLLIFGGDILDVGLKEISLFSIQNINDCTIVYSCAAEKLNNNDADSKLLKSKLWQCLKQLFNV